MFLQYTINYDRLSEYRSSQFSCISSEIHIHILHHSSFPVMYAQVDYQHSFQLSLDNCWALRPTSTYRQGQYVEMIQEEEMYTCIGSRSIRSSGQFIFILYFTIQFISHPVVSGEPSTHIQPFPLQLRPIHVRVHVERAFSNSFDRAKS